MAGTAVRLSPCSLRYLERALPAGEQGIALLDHEKAAAGSVPAVCGLRAKRQAGQSAHGPRPHSPCSGRRRQKGGC